MKDGYAEAWVAPAEPSEAAQELFGRPEPVGPSPKPFLRWAGGKTRLLGSILPYVPERFRAYREPFLGSGAVFFAVRQRATAGHHLSDLNEQLINTWTVVRDQPEAFFQALACYRGKDEEVDYYEVRGAAPTTPIESAARFFYLNQTAWNSLWRVNRWGVFNVPWGARPFRSIELSALQAVHHAVRDASIQNADFRSALRDASGGDFVYLDPPYLPVSDTSKFSGYTERRFRRSDLEELAALTRELSARGVQWIMSNRDTPLVRELFSHARLLRFTTRRSVSAQNRRNVEPVASPEILVVGLDQT